MDTSTEMYSNSTGSKFNTVKFELFTHIMCVILTVKPTVFSNICDPVCENPVKVIFSDIYKIIIHNIKITLTSLILTKIISQIEVNLKSNSDGTNLIVRF